MLMFKSKKAIELDMLAWWLIGLAILVIGVLAYFILTGKLTGGLDFIKNLFRFG